MWSQQNHVQVGSWNEFDWWVSADWTIAKYWKTGVTYITFLSPTGNFRQERNIEPYIRFDDGALTGWAFTINPYVKLFYAIAGDSTVVVGNQGDTYDVEIGIVPTLDLKKITGVPLTIAAPTWVTVGPSSYWNRGVTGCGLATTTPCSLSNAGVFTTGLALKETLDWLVPTRWGPRYAKGCVPDYHIINRGVVDARRLERVFRIRNQYPRQYAGAHRLVAVRVEDAGLTRLRPHSARARADDVPLHDVLRLPRLSAGAQERPQRCLRVALGRERAAHVHRDLRDHVADHAQDQ